MKTKVEPLVNLNVNPCKMCMPMGAATAFYGIKGCISILHGSQGCATYIRRHMATHYNEPVDIASSSLTEQGTVYGGEKNLKKGLNNLISLYNPKVVGVATTCLAETIGEDLKRIIYNFYEENPDKKDIMIIPVCSAGYGGTQYEGYFKTLYSIVSEVPMDQTPNEKINIIASTLSPADARTIKEILEDFDLDYVLLPDISENLDGVYKPDYSRLSEHGTDLEDIKSMAGARVTLELTDIEMDCSPGKYLEETYGVPFKRLNLPIGLRDNDMFLKALQEISGKKIPEKYQKQRGRYLDAMVDGHKYNAEGRAAIFGEPDFIISTVRLCCENGVVPVVVATGSSFPGLKEYVEKEIKQLADKFFVEQIRIQDNADFTDIEAMAKETKANLLIGNSDGRRMEENLNIPLVRRAFPVHDRVGGQRLRMVGYEGTLTYLDEISNVLLSHKETTFRETLFTTYYQGTAIDQQTSDQVDKAEEQATTQEEEIRKKTLTHPCYNCAGHKYARMHLPVAPRCNVQCNYCVRKFDCPNESRPGVTTKVLTPEEAAEKYRLVKAKVPNLTVVGIAGPGDALANFEETKKTMELIRKEDKDVTFCVSTNGLMLPNYAEELVKLGVSHVTITVNAVDPKIGGKIYKYINYMGQKYEGEAAGVLLLTNQLAGIRILVAHKIVCKVNIVTLKGINDFHIPEVVKKMKEIGCYITNIMPHIRVEGSTFENLETCTNKEIEKLRTECGETLLQMTHCKQCRADAIGTLDHDLSIEFKSYQPTANEQKNAVYRFAVATNSGVYVDQHFGQVVSWYIYEYKNGKAKFIEKRNVEKYCDGGEQCDGEEDKIQKIARAVEDCKAVISMRIGEAPKRQLLDKNIQVITTFDRIEDAVMKAGNEM